MKDKNSLAPWTDHFVLSVRKIGRKATLALSDETSESAPIVRKFDYLGVPQSKWDSCIQDLFGIDFPTYSLAEIEAAMHTVSIGRNIVHKDSSRLSDDKEQKQHIMVELAKRGWSITDLAEQIGVSRSFVSVIISGKKRCPECEYKISLVLCRPMDFLFPNK